MELEFDKEIDALLRGQGTATGSTPGNHLDADELTAFAENAMPERSRALYTRHMADCDRCRKILSNFIVLNSEADAERPAAESAIKGAAASLVWYRKLFLFPNLAYVMGGMILVFGGLISVSLYRGAFGDQGTSVSQVSEAEPGRGPMARTDPQLEESFDSANKAANSNSANMAAAGDDGNIRANTATSAANAIGRTAVASPDAAPSGITMDGMDAAKPAEPVASAPAAAPPPAAQPELLAKDADAARETETARAKKTSVDEQKEDKSALKRTDDLSMKSRSVQESAPRTQAGGPAKAKPGPSRDLQQNFPNRSENTFDLKSRRVSGRDFQFRNGAWYDTAYRGQNTTNVRRGTDEFRGLDSGLRTIANQLSGVIVTVWEGKAYRIQ